MKEELLKLLNELLERKMRYCNGYKDSGDSGLCHATEVVPLENMIKYVKGLEE